MRLLGLTGWNDMLTGEVRRQDVCMVLFLFLFFLGPTPLLKATEFANNDTRIIPNF
jgi:hypothetical protein